MLKELGHGARQKMSFDTIDLLTGNKLQVTWDLGRRCNYDCSYCPAHRHDNFSPHATLEELKANDLYLRGKRGQPYVYLESPLKFVKKENQERLYLETKTRNLGMQHRGHNYLLLTDEGLILYDTENKKTNFKHGERIRQKIRSLPSDRFLLDSLIDIARQADFKSGYNSEWVYMNFYARHLINILKKTMRNN